MLKDKYKELEYKYINLEKGLNQNQSEIKNIVSNKEIKDIYSKKNEEKNNLYNGEYHYLEVDDYEEDYNQDEKALFKKLKDLECLKNKLENKKGNEIAINEITETIKNSFSSQKKNMEYDSKKDLIKNSDNEIKNIYAELERIKTRRFGMPSYRGPEAAVSNDKSSTGKTMKIFVDGKLIVNSNPNTNVHSQIKNEVQNKDLLYSKQMIPQTLTLNNTSVCIDTEVVKSSTENEKPYDYDYYQKNIKNVQINNFENVILNGNTN